METIVRKTKSGKGAMITLVYSEEERAELQRARVERVLAEAEVYAFTPGQLATLRGTL